MEEGIANLELSQKSITNDSTKRMSLWLVRNLCDIKAWAYLKGIGTEQNFEQAYTYYKKALDYGKMSDYGKESVLNNPNFKIDIRDLSYYKMNLISSHDVSLPLSYCYLLGIGTLVDYDKAKECFNHSSDGYFINTDFNNYLWTDEWNKQHGVSDDAIKAYRKGMIYWLVDRDFEKAKAKFEEAIQLGHIPSMCELGMMYLDDDMKQEDGEKLFIEILNAAANGGYPAAKHIIGLQILNHWGKSIYSGSNEGKAYYYFEEASKMGFEPANEYLARYENGSLSRKTGLAAALSDLNEGFNDGRAEKKSLGENLVEVGAGYAALGQALSSGGSSNSSGSSSSSVSRSSAGRSTSSGGSSSSAGTSSSDKQYNDALQQYQKWEDKAQYWIDSFMDERAWLTHFNPQSDSQSDLSNHQSHYDSAIKELKAILTSFKQCRQKSDNQIAKGEIEEKVEWCLSQGYPK